MPGWRGNEGASGQGLALVFGDAGLFAGSGWNWTFVLIKKISALAIGRISILFHVQSCTLFLFFAVTLFEYFPIYLEHKD
ncbi:hypothetical protein EGY22_10790 [Alcaligenes faecalis]|nr:hypothetical protein CPY64_05020 [Alcaligenes faecalis]AYZ91919.1 hypothetical protein EGY22_10790 [Alcaligenes faecalis]CAJ0900264.1 protein of unknown function [Alcaligenes faecalis subsp. faecalis]